ncbi:metalloproteinase inhibitor 2-like [Corythoichthys intestinalis]|uniref:metalloproteinase inhibitor 2-like n=1 Tax=Corythoichthys intestinalis TaxID=161448 RepID=UPI0025A542EB|nr:metalloproteinase inhibitor 2-like [Corythoichthys intestinalis]
MMSWTVASSVLVLLCWWGLQEGTHACTCLPRHPQEIFCQSDVVITAKVGKVKDDGDFDQPIKYDIELTRTFKGPERLFHAIYTASSSAACGVILSKDTEYLLMARLHPDGTLHISSCDFYQPWRALTYTQKSLLDRYQQGCNCKIEPCYSLPCDVSGPNVCRWTDFLPGVHRGNQTQNYACVRRRDDTCAWYKGRTSPVKG